MGTCCLPNLNVPFINRSCWLLDLAIEGLSGMSPIYLACGKWSLFKTGMKGRKKWENKKGKKVSYITFLIYICSQGFNNIRGVFQNSDSWLGLYLNYLKKFKNRDSQQFYPRSTESQGLMSGPVHFKISLGIHLKIHDEVCCMTWVGNQLVKFQNILTCETLWGSINPPAGSWHLDILTVVKSLLPAPCSWYLIPKYLDWCLTN